ncbi:hypothetical protein F0H08_03720 [Campylobacter jejuni]|uniref:DUF2513 domain-containing protein n=4 Tax=Campylobacter TaxID=194 RepID=A0A5Y8R1X5_CAMCO|nr:MULTISPECIES: hypothetical protein [Campylobacter]EAH4524749.1 hypothetical protein [Campylobacter jejuni]EAH4758264.1 hypothetical protein [Campylobacter jejuni]EAH5815100.1 hypothetical protein [Campylobacter jejuni]EAH6072108.1 hypothetical protein [Campylobacter jejuni]EAH6249839.1 hypothetical protein [Campylobacter jejuni]
MNNLEHFDICTGRVFKILLENFPLKSDILLQNIISETQKDIVELEKIYYHSILYLEELELIKIQSKTMNPIAFLNVSLSAKGLSILRATPKSLQNGETLADRILKFSNKTNNEILKHTISYIFELIK